VPSTVSSYLFPPPGLAMNVHHIDGCSNSFSAFGGILVEPLSHIAFTLVSEFEIVVNSVLVGSGCDGCKIIYDDTFGLFAQHHTPSAALFLPSESTAP